jgi:hypothetical protein
MGDVPNGLKVDNDGNFYKWVEILDVEVKVEPDTANVQGSKIPGINMAELLKPHVGSKVRVIVQVKKE